MRILVVIAFVLLVTGCNKHVKNWCYKKYPIDTTLNVTHEISETQVPVISPGKHFYVPVFVDCDTITDTLTIWQEITLPPDTIYTTITDTVTVVKKGEIQTIREKNKVNMVLIGVSITLFIILTILLWLLLKAKKVV